MKNLNLALNSEVAEFIQENGKYGVAALAMWIAGKTIYEIALEAIQNGYELTFQFGKEKNEIRFFKPECA